MPNYWIHVPVSGALDIVIEAESIEKAVDNYIVHREDYMKFHNNQLIDNIEDIQIIKVNNPISC